LSAILGVEPSLLTNPSKQIKAYVAANMTPATWYKFRGEGLVDADREFVFLIRRLGNFIGTLEDVTQNRATGWEEHFKTIQANIDRQAPPRQQGREAARVFRASRGLNKGATGIGEVVRGNLRNMGILLVETPLPDSKLEGCSFYVGLRPTERPCLFANTHHLTWFRRNVVLMHELAHAIFDSPNAGASIDFQEAVSGPDLAEQRADAFAKEALIPKEVLRHVAQAHGIRWDNLSAGSLAAIVAETHVEQKKILEAAFEADLISHEQFESYQTVNVSSELPRLSEHALSTQEYLRKIGREASERIGIGKRSTTIPMRSIRLPIPYIDAVVNAFHNKQISRGKAAEMLMVDEDTFTNRFGGRLDTFADQ
jgi:Zn-dependent peptidase ImmA (M78 family)